MTLREMNAKYYEPLSQGVMILGLVFLVQPWIEVLHRYGLTVTIIGLIGFLITSHIPPEPEAEEEKEDEIV